MTCLARSRSGRSQCSIARIRLTYQASFGIRKANHVPKAVHTIAPCKAFLHCIQDCKPFPTLLPPVEPALQFWSMCPAGARLCLSIHLPNRLFRQQILVPSNSTQNIHFSIVRHARLTYGGRVRTVMDSGIFRSDEGKKH